ncbi:MAG: tetratricopeptide repeat protein [Bryobacteraceae bacterium]
MTSVLRLLFVLPLVCAAAENGYIGREVCAGCHKQIAATQVQTNMARTWQGVETKELPAEYSEIHAEGPPPAIEYALKRTGQKLQYRVQMPGHPAQELPVETVIGGERHGLSFLLRVPALEGSPLPLARLVEARYFHSAAQNRLAFSLGFPEDKPSTYETAFGRVLTPYLERRCLSCHVQPRSRGTQIETGVSCENCHGPGQPHLVAISKHSRDLGILNPKKLPVAERMRPCSQCHAGSSLVADPLPDDLLISDQVTALKNSECWRESAGGITCTNCHDPHKDASRHVLVARAEKTCLGCHRAPVANHAALCPVNRITGCVGCHMPNQIRGAFAIAEHWIRVHPGQNVKAAAHNPAWRSTIAPKHLYLRMIVLDDRAKASLIRNQLLSGGSFFELARSNSIDQSTAVNGGYLGDLEASKLDPGWSAAALKLQPGEISHVLEANDKYFIVQRMSRNFREDAQALFDKAMELRKQGKQQESINQMLEALKIYPRLLRALTWLGAAYGEGGNPTVSAGILTIATQLYPQDAGAHFNLAIAYGALKKDDELAEYKRTIDIDPDYVPAYLNWGGALYAKGQYEEAIQLYRQGINVNPLNASLHYSLSTALEQQNKMQEANDEMALALKIDPNVGKH